MMSKFWFNMLLTVLIVTAGCAGGAKMTRNMVKLETSMGDIVIELYPDKAPITVKNFLTYVNENAYDETVFHRVINNFMIQGGGFTSDGKKKETYEPIKLESNNGLKNEKGTIAMARTMVPNSATNEFFINLNDNIFLNQGVRDEGYAVFGKVVEGMDIIDKIGKIQTEIRYDMKDWPTENIIIKKAKIV